MNAFVDYLNSMHSVNGDGLGALAERQIQNPYSQQCHVSRNLGKHIAERIRAGKKHTYIITGHAGDGKTSILVQVLRELGMIEPGQSLDNENVCECGSWKLYYVKDMSEIPVNKRVTYLKKALMAPGNGMASILISNTGPLLSSFQNLRESDFVLSGAVYDEQQKLSDQAILLNQLDSNKEGDLTVDNYAFSMINIARIDNVSFAREFLVKILDDTLWAECGLCANEARCPIANNCKMVRSNMNRVMSFIESYLRYAYEYDQRLTIRQIQAQLCYALTGGLSCEKIKPHRVYSFYKYNFANSLFGYRGSSEDTAALNIKAIRMLHDMDLDAVALPADYDLFVKNNISALPQAIQDIVEQEVLPELKKLNRSAEAEVKTNNKRGGAIRKAMRRSYLVFSCHDEQSLSTFFDKVFGEGFSIYLDLAAHPNQTRAKLRVVRDTIFDALYFENTGFLTNTGVDNAVPLTLHRKDGIFQSVMLVLGKVYKSELKVVQKSISNVFEDEQGRQRVVLELKDEQFWISLPLFLHFVSMKKGAVSSACNPALTHNISRLETLLVELYRTKDASEMQLLINTTKGQIYQHLEISDDAILWG